MAHLTSYQMGGAVAILRHNERTEKDKVHSRKNEKIVPARTHLNYNLAPRRKGNLSEHIAKICSDNGIRLNKRKDLNVMSSWIITQPQDIKAEESKKFFEDTYSFLINRYGKENVLSACVHLDETTPHIHFEFIPVGTDGNGQRTVSSKLVCTRSELKIFHKDLGKHLSESFGRKISIENGATVEGNKSIDELKRGTATQTLKNTLRQADEVQGRVTTLKTACTQIEGNLEHLRGIETEINKKPAYATVKNKAFKGEIIELPAEKYTAERYKALIDSNKLSQVEDSYNRIKQEYDSLCESRYKLNVQYSKLKTDYSDLHSQTEQYKDMLERSERKCNKLSKRLEVTNEVLAEYPDISLSVREKIKASEQGNVLYREVTERQLEKLRWSDKNIDFDVREKQDKIIIQYDKADEQEISHLLSSRKKGLLR